MKEKRPKVAIQGIRASSHEEAAFLHFGEDIQTIECNSFKQTFEALQNWDADYVVMAIENSIAGNKKTNKTQKKSYNYTKNKKENKPNQLHLLALPGVKFEDIK